MDKTRVTIPAHAFPPLLHDYNYTTIVLAANRYHCRLGRKIVTFAHTRYPALHDDHYQNSYLYF